MVMAAQVLHLTLLALGLFMAVGVAVDVQTARALLLQVVWVVAVMVALQLQVLQVKQTQVVAAVVLEAVVLTAEQVAPVS
jgi:hypothetical protein